MGGQGWISKGTPNSSGPKKSKNKFKKFGDKVKSTLGVGRDIDKDLKGQRQLLQRRISFVPAKRAQNGDIAASLSAANGAKKQNVRKDSGPSGAGGKRRPEEELFQEVDTPLFPRVRIRRILEWKKVSKIGPGLHNLGNTCFCNAVLQCLTYTAPLANFCLSREHTNRLGNGADNGKYDALLAIEKHVMNAFGSEKGAIRPTTIVNNLKKIGPRLKVGRQEDAHEFTRLLIEGMHLADLGACRFTASPYSRPAQTGVLHSIFGGHLRSQVHCESCKFNSNTYDAFLDLSLEIRKANSVMDALKSFTKIEVLDGANKYKCSSCGCKTRATKCFSLHRTPYVLQLHLKRFETQWGGHSAKISRHISFPMTLSVEEFMSKGEESTASTLTYSLYGVVVHSGHSVRSGHYLAYVKNSNGVWYEMDDDQVRSVSATTVMKQQAYMLFYIQQPAGANSPAVRPKSGSSPLLQAQMSPSARNFATSPSLASFGLGPSAMPGLSLSSAAVSARMAAPKSLSSQPRNSNRDSEDDDDDSESNSMGGTSSRPHALLNGKTAKKGGAPSDDDDASDEESDGSYDPEVGSSPDALSDAADEDEDDDDENITSEDSSEGGGSDTDDGYEEALQEEAARARTKEAKVEEKEVTTPSSNVGGAALNVSGSGSASSKVFPSIVRRIVTRGRSWLLQRSPKRLSCENPYTHTHTHTYTHTRTHTHTHTHTHTGASTNAHTHAQLLSLPRVSACPVRLFYFSRMCGVQLCSESLYNVRAHVCVLVRVLASVRISAHCSCTASLLRLAHFNISDIPETLMY